MRALTAVFCVVGVGLPHAAASDPPEKPATALTTAQAQAVIREVSATVEQLRRLKFKSPVAVEVVDAATARKDFESELDEEARTSAGHTRDAWVQLGLVPRGTDLVAAHADRAEKDVLGYYHSGSKTFRVLDHVSEAEMRTVMAHELTHALEDQHYDLGALQKRASNEDHAVALRAVVEGSAMVTTLAMTIRQGGIGKAQEEAARTGQRRAKTVQSAPAFDRMRLLLPYTLGFSFLLRGKPWEYLASGVRIEDIEQAYAQPPDSTREILHPERYWGGHREAVRRLSLPDLAKVLGPGWSLKASGCVGELGLTLLTGSTLKTDSFEALLPTRWITAAASGNAGELYHHYVNGERKVTLLLTRWDSFLAADEFQRSLKGADKTVYRLGANIVVLVGDFGDKGQPLAVEAFQRLPYWAGS